MSRGACTLDWNDKTYLNSALLLTDVIAWFLIINNERRICECEAIYVELEYALYNVISERKYVSENNIFSLLISRNILDEKNE